MPVLGHSLLGANNFDLRSVPVFSVRTCSSDFLEDLCAKGDYSLAAVYLLTWGRGRLLWSHR